MSSFKILLTCEHATHRSPLPIAERILTSHRGWDAGALVVARTLHERFAWPLIRGQVSRLVIDLNRSLDHENLFSHYSQNLSSVRKQKLVDQYYLPYRENVEQTLAQWMASGARVAHLSIHSFAATLKGEKRPTDVGLLFDPKRRHERQLALQLRRSLKPFFNQIHFNRPYRGTDDGLTTYLRTRFSDIQYQGLEIEINQRHVKAQLTQSADSIAQAFQILRDLAK